MGDTKLFVLLLVYAIVIIDAQDDEAVCLLAKRYKSFHKYEYLYEAESLNTLNGAINGPKVSCQVEIEVPGPCHFIVHTKECTLSEVISVDANGNPIFGSTAGAEMFKAQMEKHPLKVIVEGDNDIKLFPEDDELINILNIKRGVISALAVPALQDEKNNNMPTIYGMCETDYNVNTREDIATDVTLNRDLSRCDQFRPIKDYTSPLAIITDMHSPLAPLIRSKQTCRYKFDNVQKHMTSGVCTEDHLLLPFSHKGTYGVSSVSKQTLALQGVTKYNERVFDHKEDNVQALYLDESVDMSPNQDKNAILAVLRELAGLCHTTSGHKRAHLAYKLVAVMRKMNAETLSGALPEALEISPSLTYQALFQCGTPECSTAFMQILKTFRSSVAKIDAVVYALGMIPNPSPVLVKEMLEMAKLKPSKLIYYATSNAVRRLYKTEGKVTPEIREMADYVLENIGDCTGDQEHIYLTLRVTGNMAEAVGAASPALKSAVIQCINQPAASTEVQQAAIQVFRLTPVPDEGGTVLMQVFLDRAAPVQKRIAAYLILMKDPQRAKLEQVFAALSSEENLQVKSFVLSHLNNILSSTSKEIKELSQTMLDVLQSDEVKNLKDASMVSRNYKIGSLEGNMIFDKENKLPTEVMLEMTLNAFGYDIDMVEVGMEGKGLDPTVEALFGPKGFFPDTVMKTIFYATDKMPSQIKEVLKTIIPALNDNKKKQGPKNIMKEIGKNVDKLIKKLKTQDDPEAMIYLRLLGAELGYLKTKDLEEMANTVTSVAQNLLRMFPIDFKSLFSSADNELFLHYIFMDNEFYLPTGPGLPLRVALSGIFTPGVKGGLRISPDMSEIAFMPSAGIEFVTEFGAHLPDYVHSGLEMHTNIFHESGMRAKIAMTRNQIKLSVPTPESPVKLLSVSNSMLSVAGDKTQPIPAITDHIDVNECTPLFSGVKFCNARQYSDATRNDASPYFPLSGDSKFAIELHPTADVSEYTATLNYAHEENTDKVTFDVKAEGTTFEATSKVMFNRKEYTLSAEFQIPDYDIEAGIRIGAADPSNKDKSTHSIQIDFINKNIPHASLVGLAKIEAMNNVLLQVQLLVPSLEADAKVTASLKRVEEMTLELESDIKFLDASSVQKLVLKYDDEKVEAHVKSNVSTKTQNIVSKLDAIKADIGELLNQHIGQTKTKVCDVLASSIATTNLYLEASNIPYLENLRVPSLPEFEVPETLFLNTEADARYHFGKHYHTISIPVPLGGKSTKDLNFPPTLTTPNLDLPQLGLNIASIKVPLPELFIPKTVTLSLPTIGKAEVAGKLSSNLYNLEANVSAGRDSDERPNYSASLVVTGSGPVDVLSFRVEGSTLVSGTMTDTLRAEMSTAVSHKLFHASINIAEEVQLMEEISIKSTSKLEATSPFNVKFSLEHAGQVGVNAKGLFGNNNLQGSFVTGPLDDVVILKQSLALIPFKPEARIDSTLEINSRLLQAENKLAASFVDGELSVVSNSAVFKDMLTHKAEVTLTRSKYAFKSDTKSLDLGLNIHNTAEADFGAEGISIKLETTNSQSENHINSLFIATANINGLVVNSNASVKLAEHTATHKASLTLDKNGLVTSGTTSVNSLLTLMNTFSGILDSSKFSLSTNTKGEYNGMAIDNTNEIFATMLSIDLTSKSRVDLDRDIWYIYDISVQAEPYSATAGMTSHLNLDFDIELKNTCEIKLAGLTGNAKCSTSGKLFGAHLNDNTEIEIVGLGVRINNDARFNSELVRFSTSIQANAAPFTINLHALANGDGELHWYGKHSSQVYTKVLLKAEPLALAHSHECRFSTTHELDNNVIFEANVEKKVDTQLSLSEQSASVTLKSKMNNHVFNQELRAYNNHERIGMEVSGAVNYKGSQEFSMSALLQYDKNTESHVISLPLLESLPAVIENIKITSVTLIEALQDFIKSDEFIVKIQTLVQHFADSVTEFHFEEKVEKLKNSLIAYAQKLSVTPEELEAVVRKLRTIAQRAVAELSTRVSDIQELIVSGDLSDTILQKVTSLSEEYDMRGMLLTVIEAIENVIEQIDMTKLEHSGIPVYYDVEKLNAIKLHLQQYVTELKNMVTNFDKAQFVDQMQNIIETTEVYTQHLLNKFPREEIRKIANALKELITELDFIGEYKVIYSTFRGFVIKYELDKRAEEILDKVLELIKQFKIDETIQILGSTLKSIQIPFPHMLDNALTYLKTSDMKQIINDLNQLLEGFVKSLKSFEYNTFVDEANQKINEYTAKFNKLILSLELPQKFEATRDFINHALSSMSNFVEELRSDKISDIIKTLKDLIDTVVFNDLKRIFEKFKQHIIQMDIRKELTLALQQVSDIYSKALAILTNALNDYFEVARELFDQPIVAELKQISDNVLKALKTSELEIPSFTVPFTDLVLPSQKFSLQQLLAAEIPEQFNIPEFTILGSYTVPAITITLDDIKQLLIELAEFIINFNIEKFHKCNAIEKLTMYLPDLSAVKLPAITLPQISMSAIPKLNEKYILDIPLQIPEIKLPKIPNALILPAFGKLLGKISVNCPIYTHSTKVEVRNSTDSEQKHHFMALISSVGQSSSFDILNYNLDATLRIGLPRMSRVVIADTLKFIHTALNVEHQASVTLYGRSAQGNAVTTLRVTTAPYTADISNKAFFAVEGGMTASSDTTYKHRVMIPILHLTNEATMIQSAVILQKDGGIRLTVGNSGTSGFDLSGFVLDEFTHKSNLVCTVAPDHVIFNFTGDTDGAAIKIKKKMIVEAVAFSHINFNGSIETQSLFVKTSRMLASGIAQLGSMKVEVEATHETELIGAVSGTLSNEVRIKVCPTEIIVAFQNKGNTKVILEEYFATKIDLQNDYALIINSKNQHVKTAALLRISQNKFSYNFTVENNNDEIGIYSAVNGETDLEFLNVPISVPEISIPGIDLTIPAINDFNLYETCCLKYLQTIKPAVDVNAKIVYQKNRLAQIDFGFIRVPAAGNLISEMSFKSSIFTLNTNAGIYGEKDLVIRIAATSTSLFEELKAKLEGISSLTLHGELKLANALTLKNAYIEGAHNSTFTVNTESLNAMVAVTTAATVNLPTLTTEVNHNLLVDTKDHPITISTLMIKQKFDLPIIRTAGSGAVEHTLKIDVPFISIKSTTKSMIDGTFLETGIVKGTLDNEANMYMTGNGLHSKLKTIGNININRGTFKVEFDVNEDFNMASAPSRVYTDLNIISNNEVNIATFNTKGKHATKAIVHLVPLSSLSANVEVDLSQPTSFGDFTIQEKTVVDVTLSKQKISYSTKMVSPVYTTNTVVEMESDTPVFKIVFKSSSESPAEFLKYDLDSYVRTEVENEILNARAKASLEHNAFTVDFNSVFTPSVPSHILNVDITSPTYTDVNLRYAAQIEGMNVSISSPSAGFLGFQLQGKSPSQLTSRFYGHYASAPKNEIDILSVNVVANGDRKIHFQADCNLEAPTKMILGMRKRLNLITSIVTNFAEKSGILEAFNGLKSVLVTALNEAYTISNNHTPDVSRVSVLFRNIVGQHQKAIQQLLDAAVTFLRETQIKLPGMKEATVPEICKQIKSSIAEALEDVIQSVKTLIGDENFGYLENALIRSVNMIKQLESLDVILEKLGEVLQACPVKPGDGAIPSWSGPQEESVSQSKEQPCPVQAMYCKELLLAGGTEFSFEELRSQRYFKQLNEKVLHLNKVKEELKFQIEQKQKLIQGRNGTSQPQGFFQTPTVSCAPVVPKDAASLKFSNEPDICINSAIRNSIINHEDMAQGTASVKQRSSQPSKSFAIYDENVLPEKPNTRSSSVNLKSLKLPTSILKSRQPASVTPSDKDASLSRSEEAIINAHSNKTLCRSPEDTYDFIHAAQLASTPFGGLGRQNSSERGPMEENETLNKTGSVTFKEPSSQPKAETKKLSPIQEISHEWGHISLASTYPLEPDLQGLPTTDSGITEVIQPTSGNTVFASAMETEPVNPCSLKIRKALLDTVDLSSFANFRRKSGSLPEPDDLHLDGETLFFLKKIGDWGICLYLSNGDNVLVKVDESTVPWDFYINSQLRARMNADLQHCHAQSTCYLYENGSLTLWQVPQGQTIQELLDNHVDKRDVLLLAIRLLEMVKLMHSCRLVHGSLQPETLIVCHSCEDKVISMDFSNSLDLEQQSDVKTVQSLPSAQVYIEQGLLLPSASPYQVDLCGIAQIVHLLLFGRNMMVIKDTSFWTLADDSGPLDWQRAFDL
ncbi:apolipoprotein, partial [Clarias magur]